MYAGSKEGSERGSQHLTGKVSGALEASALVSTRVLESDSSSWRPAEQPVPGLPSWEKETEGSPREEQPASPPPPPEVGSLRRDYRDSPLQSCASLRLLMGLVLETKSMKEMTSETR